MKVQMMPIDRLIPYARNPRKNDAAVDAVAASIKEFGFRQPIVVDEEMVVLVGHTRLKAARKLGLAEVPVHAAEGLTPAQKRAYRIADNRLNEIAEWDDELLEIELDALADDGFEVDLTGFDDAAIAELLGEVEPDNTGQTDEDAVPEAGETLISRSGDVWLLGPHRLVCGDATTAESYAKLFPNGERSDMVFTDPPYNVAYAAGSHVPTLKRRPIANDDLGDGFEAFLRDALSLLMAHCQGALYIAMSSSEIHTLRRVFEELGGHWSTFIIWAKNTFTLGRSDYQRQYEPILYGWPEGATRYWCGDRDQGDVWQIKKPAKNDLHPTMKPVELVERAIRNSSRPRNVVLDPFGGSGTTLIAAEKAGRVARLIELDPKYVDVAVRRWQDFTGKQAIRESDGKPFDECRN